MTSNDAPAALRELLDQLRDHVARFGGVSWLRERGVDTGPLEAVADGETAGEHYERIREAVRADVAARADEALGGLTPSAGGPSADARWPRFADGAAVLPGDAVWLAGRCRVVTGFDLGVAAPGDLRRPTAEELARAIVDGFAGATPRELPDAVGRAVVFARGILARLAEGGDRDAR